MSCELLRAGGFFALEPLVRSVSTEYKLVTLSELDREQRDEYQLTIVCRDAGVPALSRSRDLVVRVADTNDHAPQFERRSLRQLLQRNRATHYFISLPDVA